MPFFEYECECGSSGERLVVTNGDRTCPDCGRGIKLAREVESPFAGICIRVTPTYFDHGLGMNITGPAHRQQVMKENDLVEVGDYKHLDDIPRGKQETEVLTDEEFTHAWVNEVVEKKNSDAVSAEESW